MFYFRLMNLVLMHILSSSSQVVSLPLIILVWFFFFFFELILSYFGSDNWILIRNLKLKTLVVKKNSCKEKRKHIKSDLFGLSGLLRSISIHSIYFVPIWSASVHSGPIQSTSVFSPHQSSSVWFGAF